ncbi:MAG: PDZ domain-containing protein [Calditrichaeota bacterium]|nr:MAG: PDZ domain-containing protein [Calditrichota bacterium]
MKKMNFTQFILIGSLVLFSVETAKPSALLGNEALKSNSSATQSIFQSRENAITRAVEKVSNSVVGINVTQVREYRQRYYTDDQFFQFLLPFAPMRKKVKSLGSGFIIDSNGFVLTNEHVVHNAIEIKVTLTDGSQHDAELVGADEISDIALLRLKDFKKLQPVQFSSDDDLIIGEWVIAFGNPFGLFDLNAKPTVTVGVISSLNQDFGKMEDRVYKDMIQTDASINQGNSGGPLVNSLGEVIGMNTFIFSGEGGSGSIGLGFAIPASRVLEIVKELRTYGKVNRSFWTGLSLGELSPRIARYLGLNSINGVIVTDVQENSPADEAGIQLYDVIYEVNGKNISRRQDILNLINASDLRGGDVLNFKIYREGRLLIFPVRLEKLN